MIKLLEDFDNCVKNPLYFSLEETENEANKKIERKLRDYAEDEVAPRATPDNGEAKSVEAELSEKRKQYLLKYC